MAVAKKEAMLSLAVIDKVVITKSPQFLTPLPGVLALKAIAQTALSTNVFEAASAGTSVVTSNSKAALIAEAVAESVASPIVLSNKVIVKVQDFRYAYLKTSLDRLIA